MEKKYILTDNVKRVEGKTVRQIQAVRNFSNIRKGELGGYVQSEENLSHDGYCWVYEDGVVADHAKVIEDARVVHGMICDSATISDRALIGLLYGSNEFPQILGNAVVTDKATVTGHAIISGFATIKDYASVSDYAHVTDNVVMENNTHAFHYAFLFGDAHLKDGSFVCGHCKVGGDITLIEHCCVADDSALIGEQTLSSYENQKYKLLKNDTIDLDGKTLYRIVSLQDAPFCHYGEKGGYIESEKNLSQIGNAWITYPCYAMGDTVIDRETLLK